MESLIKKTNMAQPWFKFYGGKYLSDSKLAGLTTAERCCWIALLCLASQSEDSSIRFLTVDGLLRVAGIPYDVTSDYSEWESTQKVFETFKKIGLIKMPDEDTIILTNFQKRQDSYLTEAEKKRNYREKQKKVDNVHPGQVDLSTSNREDKIREDNTKPSVDEEPWETKKYLQTLRNDKQRHIQVIGLYWAHKGYEFPNKVAAAATIKRDLRAARALIGYDDTKIMNTMEYLDNKADYKWTLETVHKFITDLR